MDSCEHYLITKPQTTKTDVLTCASLTMASLQSKEVRILFEEVVQKEVAGFNE